jgi:hypothetical protein
VWSSWRYTSLILANDRAFLFHVFLVTRPFYWDVNFFLYHDFELGVWQQWLHVYTNWNLLHLHFISTSCFWCRRKMFLKRLLFNLCHWLYFSYWQIQANRGIEDVLNKLCNKCRKKSSQNILTVQRFVVWCQIADSK